MQFGGDLHLRFDAGSYEVVLYTQVANTQLAELVRFTVTTSTAQDERDLLPSFASGVVSGTDFVPQYDARYFDPAPDP